MVLEGRPALLRQTESQRLRGVAEARFAAPATGLPPHDIGAEEAVLAALLLDGNAIDRCLIARLKPEHFFREHNGWVYAACCAIAERGEAVTLPTVAHEMERAGRLDAAGGEPYLAEVVGRHFTAIGVETHAAIVIRDSRYRSLIAASSQIAQLAYEGGPDQRSVLALSLDLITGVAVSVNDGLERLGYGRLDDSEGMQWGIPALDRYTMGITSGGLTIVAGSSGEGKSMFAAQIVRNVAAAGGGVAVFTMEMASREYEARITHAVAAVRKRYSRYAAPLTPVERGLLGEAQTKVAAWGIRSSARAGVTANEIASAVRLAKAEHGVDLVVVDYLQLMGRPDNRESEASNLKAITGALKNLATEVGCHMLVVSQLNRAALSEMRGTASSKMECIITHEKYPRPLKEFLMGGAVENDADLVVMLQRHTGEQCSRMGHMQVVIAKNRNGRDGDGMMLANFGVCRFETMTAPEIAAVARGDMATHRALMIDQGLYDDDGYEQEAAATPPEQQLHNAYEFDAETERLLNIAAAIDPAQRRAQTKGAVQQFADDGWLGGQDG